MPFAMTHLYIAYNILSDAPQIKKPCDFMLGAIASDSVHFRENYNSDMPNVTALCISGRGLSELLKSLKDYIILNPLSDFLHLKIY